MAFDAIFQPLKFKNLTVKNRLFRSNISGRFDNYDGSGNQARINWETKFAKGGVGAIISSFVPVHLRGRIVPNYAMIDHDAPIKTDSSSTGSVGYCHDDDDDGVEDCYWFPPDIVSDDFSSAT